MESTVELRKAHVGFEMVQKLILELYGLTVIKSSELNGYDDRNFLIKVDPQNIDNNEHIVKVEVEGYVFKVINTLDSVEVTRFEAQGRLMVFLHEHNINCPAPVLTKRGRTFDTILRPTGEHIVLLLKFIPGEILYKMSNFTDHVFFQVGSLAARIDTVLKEFDHRAYRKPVQWCLGASPNVLNYLHAIDESKRSMVETVIEDFKNNVLAIENRLEKGIIHGDINEQNLIMSTGDEAKGIQLKAVIDFGDTHYCCFLYELALAMTYMIFLTDNPEVGGHVLAGYASVRNVSKAEIRLLKTCIMARLCQSLVLGAYGSLTDPNNEYLLTTSKKGWDILDKLRNIDNDDILVNCWLDAAKKYYIYFGS
ncbi:hydroxylysine kinase [Anthonomus grandis grandis]|uniref:hydroxylysine kinase n=1 Tax=Anthonomus grandis grandis TaxID=2921223 RepID=UPI0021651007|nr:hydroxylysine kinase [Anthonomus grandis grandis]